MRGRFCDIRVLYLCKALLPSAKVVSGMNIVRMINASGGDAVTGEGYTAGQILGNPVVIITANIKAK